MLEFILARYNYWIVICLMMTGLYIVFSRGNLVKVLMGLNLFQTSVFIFYITVGKVIGGTAPILFEDKAKKDDHHGDDHHAPAGEAHHGEGHSTAGDYASSVSVAPSGMTNEATGSHIASMADAQALVTDGAVHAKDVGDYVSEGSHHLDVPGLAPHLIAPHPEDAASLPSAAQELAGSAAYGEVLYSNPLPHVLILTAIVVGVATTAVGLSLAVRIREAYGTVEQDALEEADNAYELVEADT
ncbi:MAG: cation:proton antiporter subunit C [Parvularculaceae bacterium]|nr:cation:proton antiporter subunit C [Parvularculaceae bacterium]